MKDLALLRAVVQAADAAQIWRLCGRPAAAAPIGPLAREPPRGAGAAGEKEQNPVVLCVLYPSQQAGQEPVREPATRKDLAA